jgi:hypothetical protein
MPVGQLLPARKFLVLTSVRGHVDPRAHSAAGRIRSIEKLNDLLLNVTHILLVCSIVPPSTTNPSQPLLFDYPNLEDCKI